MSQENDNQANIFVVLSKKKDEVSRCFEYCNEKQTTYNRKTWFTPTARGPKEGAALGKEALAFKLRKRPDYLCAKQFI